MNLIWEKVQNAKGYKINIYNGKEYQSYDVGDVDHWTTQNKNIWPTSEEIKAGSYKLHTDGKGRELALDPSPVYNNANGNYKGRRIILSRFPPIMQMVKRFRRHPLTQRSMKAQNSLEQKNTGLSLISQAAS